MTEENCIHAVLEEFGINKDKSYFATNLAAASGLQNQVELDREIPPEELPAFKDAFRKFIHQKVAQFAAQQAAKCSEPDNVMRTRVESLPGEGE
jgi:hypothetical protein